MDDSVNSTDSFILKTTSSEHQNRASYLSQRAQTALQVALGKWLDSNGNMETVIQTGEAFGRGLYAEILKEQSEQWTLEDWVVKTSREILQPIGQQIETMRIDGEEAFSHITQCPLQQHEDEPYVASLFTYGLLRGLLKSAFPTGEVIMGSTLAEGAAKTEFIFKTNATAHDRLERQRVKSHFFSVMMR